MPSDLTLIDAPALAAQLEEDPSAVCLIDVRTAAEFETFHIRGSRHVPLPTLGDRGAELACLPRILLVCQSGARARQAAQQLARSGATDISLLDGGINAWLAAGGQGNRGRQRWALERQVRLVAGSLVLGGILASLAVPRLKWLSGAVGAGLVFASVSDTCAMGSLLARLPYNQGAPACDTSAIVSTSGTNCRSQAA